MGLFGRKRKQPSERALEIQKAEEKRDELRVAVDGAIEAVDDLKDDYVGDLLDQQYRRANGVD